MGVFYYYLCAVWVDWLADSADDILNATGTDENSTTYQNVYLTLDLMGSTVHLFFYLGF